MFITIFMVVKYSNLGQVVGKTSFASHTKHTAEATITDLLLS